MADAAFAKLPTAALRAALPSLTGSGAVTYLALSLYVSGRTHACWPSVSLLQRVTGLTRRSVQRGLDELTACPHLSQGCATGGAGVRHGRRRGAPPAAQGGDIGGAHNKSIQQKERTIYHCTLFEAPCSRAASPAGGLCCEKCQHNGSLLQSTQTPGRASLYKFRGWAEPGGAEPGGAEPDGPAMTPEERAQHLATIRAKLRGGPAPGEEVAL